jgi:hypothetical protein
MALIDAMHTRDIPEVMGTMTKLEVLNLGGLGYAGKSGTSPNAAAGLARGEGRGGGGQGGGGPRGCGQGLPAAFSRAFQYIAGLGGLVESPRYDKTTRFRSYKTSP